MNEPDVPKCPKCGQPMKSEGAKLSDPPIYIHVCLACNVISNTHRGKTSFEDAPWLERYKK